MPVFDGAVKIGRAVADPKTDKNLPSAGALSWGAIKSATALAGTNGADCKLVHGDRWQQIIGSQTENITGSLLTNILQNRTETITGNHLGTIVGTTTITMIGAHIELNVGTRNETRVSVVTETDCSPKAQTETTAHFKVGPLTFEAKVQKNGVYGLKIDIAALATTLYAVKVDMGGAALKTYVLELGGYTNKVDIAGMEGKINASAARIIAVGALIGALRFGTPFKPNALPTPTPITPFD